MVAAIGRRGPRALTLFADWTDRVAAGETPAAPPRPQGVERSVVITEWDWADPKAYLSSRSVAIVLMLRLCHVAGPLCDLSEQGAPTLTEDRTG
jgi:hypothetical protein